jgi:hypothetical protein
VGRIGRELVDKRELNPVHDVMGATPRSYPSSLGRSMTESGAGTGRVRFVGWRPRTCLARRRSWSALVRSRSRRGWAILSIAIAAIVP